MYVCPYSKSSDFDETWYHNVFWDAKSGSEVSFSKFSDFDETWYPNVFHDAKSESEVSFPKFEKGGSVGGGRVEI